MAETINLRAEKTGNQGILGTGYLTVKKEEKEFADAVLQVVAKANWQVIEELRGDESMCQALLELMEPEINKIVDSAVSSAIKSTKDSILLEVEEKNKKTILRAI